MAHTTEAALVIVGGGLSGLAAAASLASSAPGRVLLLEASPSLGGSRGRAEASRAALAPRRKRPALNSEEQAAAGWLAGKLRTLDANAPMEGTGAVKALRELSSTLPASLEVQTCAKVTALLRSEEGHCCGCVYTQSGVEVSVQGLVLLCAGGFLGDASAEGWLAFARPDLRHLPLLLGAAAPAPSSLALASALGADAGDLQSVRLHPTAQATHGRLRRALAQPGLIVDAKGQVVDGDRGEDEVASEMLQRPGPCRLLGRGPGPPTAARQSLAVLAQDMEVSPTSLGEALRQCGVMDDVDTMGEGYAPSSSSTSVATPRLDRPCWVTDVTPALLCCDGGLVVEDSGAVLNSEGSTIRGLFAAGEAVANRGSASPFLSCVASALRAAEAASKASRLGSTAWKPVEPVFPSKAATPPAPTEDSSVAAQMVQQRLRELLSKHLSVDVLQGVLARAHQKDGSLAAASDELLAQLLPALEIPTTSQVLQMSIKDPAGLPTRTMQTDLPQDGESLPREVNASCVHCRLPLKLQVSASKVAGGTTEPAKTNGHGPGRCAYATLLYGSGVEYFLGALVLGWSLRARGCEAERLLLHTEDVPLPFLEALEKVWLLRQVDYLHGDKAMFYNWDESRFQDVFTKLQALSCTDFDKVLMMDLDMLVRGNLDELFYLRAPAALKRCSGGEQPEHGGDFNSEDLWSKQCDSMCSGINAGVMLLEPNQDVYDRMVKEIQDPTNPEHLGTLGPEQDYLARFYSTFGCGSWTHLHAKFNYQPNLPNDYIGSAHRALDVVEDVVVAHFSGGRVKPWKVPGLRLDASGVRRLVEDEALEEQMGAQVPRSSGVMVMDGVEVAAGDRNTPLPQPVRRVMWEWIVALRQCNADMLEEGIDILFLIEQCESVSATRGKKPYLAKRR